MAKDKPVYLVMVEMDRDRAVRASTRSNVVAIYRKPTSFCYGCQGRQLGFTRGTKYGWWVCGSCFRPRKMYWDNILRDNGIGRNLIDRLRRAAK